MATSTSIVVATTPTEFTSTGVKRGNRHLLAIYNASSSTVYIGGSGVTTTSYMFPLSPGDLLRINANFTCDGTPRDKWCGVVASGTASVLITEVEAA